MNRLLISLIVLVSATLLFALRSVDMHEREMYVLPDEYLSEYVNTLDSESLFKDFETKFKSQIENVFRVDVHYKAEAGFHYYVAYGDFKGQSTVVLVKASTEAINNGTLFSHPDCSPYGYCELINQQCVPLVGLGILCGCDLPSGCYVW